MEVGRAEKYFVSKTNYRNKRDELIKKAVDHINSIREGTKFKKETASSLGKRINMNPFLAGNNRDGELERVLNDCRRKNNYSHLYFLLKTLKTNKKI